LQCGDVREFVEGFGDGAEIQGEEGMTALHQAVMHRTP